MQEIVTMSADTNNADKDSAMIAAMNMLAKKHGCKVEIDLANHSLQFDCPNKKAETDLALEINKLMGGDDKN